MYMEALTLRKGLAKKAAVPPGSPPEVELKYRLYLCLRRQDKVQVSASPGFDFQAVRVRRRVQEAVGLLEGIPVGQRTPKVKAALAALFAQLGRRKTALDYYKVPLICSPPGDEGGGGGGWRVS